MDEELVQLPWEYAVPSGRLLLATLNSVPAGCVALRPMSVNGDSSEMRRLYVRQNFRGTGIGHALVDRLIVEARAIGYRQMLLNTLPSMTQAQAIYRSVKFHDVSPYVEKPSDGVVYMSLAL